MRAIFLATALLAAPVQAGTLQQDFDAAQAKLDTGDHAGARDAFQALLGRLPPGSKGRAASLVRARFGRALLATGDAAGAEAMITAALPGFDKPTPGDAEERAVATYDLARALEAQGRIDSAAGRYRSVLDSRALPADSALDIGVRAALARTSIWSAPDEARRLLEALLALPKDKLPDGDQRALVKTLLGRVELNNGNPDIARRLFTEAARAAGGGETITINTTDMRVRGDLLIASYLLGRLDEMQRYVAYSGAGSLSGEGLGFASDRPLPACAPATGLAPDARAVVEFGVADDGRVTGVTPIYASRGSGAANSVPDGDVAALFVQAVRQWSWPADAVARTNAFWRRVVRAELRCFTERPDAASDSARFRREEAAWYSEKGIVPMPALTGASDAADLPQITAELARREREAGKSSPQLLPPLMFLNYNVAAGKAAQAEAATRRAEILAAAGAPASAIVLTRYYAIILQPWGDNVQGERRTRRTRIMALLGEAEPGGIATPIGLYLRLQLAELDTELRDSAAARAWVDSIVAMPERVLPAADPIRTAALLRQSNLAAASGDPSTAAAALAATGLAPEQCALVDVRPQAINQKVTTSDFPLEARRWGTGGIINVGYDITADGHTTNIRTITASPPFVFNQSTERAVARFRFQPVFRPGNVTGCAGARTGVTFRMSPL